MITSEKRAAYADLDPEERAGVTSFKVARLYTGDKVFGLQPVYKVPNIEGIDIKKYHKGYCIKIKKEDKLW